MKTIEQIVRTIEDNFDAILSKTGIGLHDWESLLKMHPADVAAVFGYLQKSHFLKLFHNLPSEFLHEVFHMLSVELQIDALEAMSTEEIQELLNSIPSDKLIAIFQSVDTKNLERYLKCINKFKRKNLISSLESKESSAARLVNSDVFTLQSEFTIKKSIAVLQGLARDREITLEVFVIDASHKLAGYIELGDLVRNDSSTLLSNILKKCEVKIHAIADQEEVVEIFRRYDALVLPVVDKQNHFLGIISANDVLDVYAQEVDEDTYKMAGLSSSSRFYTEVPFHTIVFQRVVWLVPLLMLQSASAIFMDRFQLLPSLMLFGTMLTGTGGNVGNQSATLMVRGLTTGEFNFKNKFSILWRELRVSICTGLVLVFSTAARILLLNSNVSLKELLVICLTLFSIIVTSTLVGAYFPIFLERFKIDPAHAAAPFIATVMDIVGILIYCGIASWVLG